MDATQTAFVNTPDPASYTARRFHRFMTSEMAARLRAPRQGNTHTPEQVTARVNAAHFPSAWAPWAVAVLCPRPEFVRHGASQGISADYQLTRQAAMRFLNQVPTSAMAGGALAVGAVAAAHDNHGGERIGLGDALDIVEAGSDLVDLAGALFELLGALG